jgi:predicted CXXCH cytochrome family protein
MQVSTAVGPQRAGGTYAGGARMSLRRCAIVLSVAWLVACGGMARAGEHPGSCADCHVSHDGGAPDFGVPLWSTANTDDGLPVFTLYHSPTFDALNTDISQPDGPSRLCLGCHDGSYPGMGAGSPDVFGTEDLALSHPISFTYDSSLAMRVHNGALNDPATTPSGLGSSIDYDLLDDQHKLQCTSCHNVHATGYGEHLLRYDEPPGTYLTLCRTCHRS